MLGLFLWRISSWIRALHYSEGPCTMLGPSFWKKLKLSHLLHLQNPFTLHNKYAHQKGLALVWESRRALHYGKGNQLSIVRSSTTKWHWISAIDSEKQHNKVEAEKQSFRSISWSIDCKIPPTVKFYYIWTFSKYKVSLDPINTNTHHCLALTLSHITGSLILWALKEQSPQVSWRAHR